MTAPAITVTTGTIVKVEFGCRAVSVDTAGATVGLSYRVSGASTATASIARAVQYEAENVADELIGISRSVVHTGLTAGSNVFTMQCSVSAGNATVYNPYIIVTPLS
jgi:hypothetical protein